MGQPSWQSLRPNPLPMPHLRLGMDITMVVGQDITEDTEDTMDGADTTDTPTDTDTTEENALLITKLLQKLPLRLMLMPLPGIIVDTMDTPTDTDTMVWDTVHTMADTTTDTTDIPTDTDTVTGDKGLLRIRTHTMVTIGGNLSRSV